ncbi:hypothetical protein XENOCAPTIV_010211 [Xenoophorus captivus]|uniref:Glucocorticoid induced 1a n=1 Tax=Xenoophorus captivus TaxID=1517983 RepID=A0ABV0S788_9TELE
MPLSNITVPKPSISRVPSSMEGINHELEKVFIKDNGDKEELKVLPLSSVTSVYLSVGLCLRSYTYFVSIPLALGSLWRFLMGVGHPSLPSSAAAVLAVWTHRLLQPPGGPAAAPACHHVHHQPAPQDHMMAVLTPRRICCMTGIKVRNFNVSRQSASAPLFSCPDKNKVNFIPTGSAFCPVKLPGSLHLTPASEPEEDESNMEASSISEHQGATSLYGIPTQVSTSTSTDDPPEEPNSPSETAEPQTDS